ncbi:MAG: ChaN family lipoprotein [Planctomycetes bacterium]|nr:ChaN family lipoprotein [Planctomycetota bacterium]
MNAREELLAMQKRLVTRLKRRIAEMLESESPEIAAYAAEYQAGLGNYAAVSSKAELAARMVESDLVYIGDYHTLRQAQKIPIRLLETVLTHPDFAGRKRPVVLGLEMFRATDQGKVDAYMEGRLPESDFLTAIDYSGTWGFPWVHYRTILEFAKARGIRVLAANAEVPPGKNRLGRRDTAVAEVIAHARAASPAALFVFLFGDLHVAESHLPSRVDEALSRRGAPPARRLVVYQNEESIYWQLAEAGHEQKVDVVKVNDRAYVVMNATPLHKLQSYLNWQDHHEELHCRMHPNWCEVGEDEIDFTGQVIELIRTICGFLELPVPPLDALTVYTTHDFDVLHSLEREVLSSGEIQSIEAMVLRNEAYFVTKANMILLTNLSINHASEQASLFLHARLAELDREAERSPRDAFYFNIVHGALGFFGSKIVNHKRLLYKEQDFAQFLDETKGRRIQDPRLLEVREIATLLLRHAEREREFLRTGKWRPLRGFYAAPSNILAGLTHAIGVILGDRLHAGLLQGIVTKEMMRDLFRNRFEGENAAFRGYLVLRKVLQEVEEAYLSKTERL